ncbi:hypothetical protein DYB36_004217 [Aphanomyces astaci]|uniref:WD repeat-containing protein 54 beta-propeller domain-containing protein n=1 Tax=Aphanomyces astaci TaxID=112090 RepID=A0A397BJS2_APHAT|nr:hypothetical protein DYB36_004217 [Aphanomyces astaci]
MKVFAHLEDVVVINPKASKPCNKITLVEKSVVYQVLVCDFGGEIHLVIATESGCQRISAAASRMTTGACSSVCLPIILESFSSSSLGSSASKLFSLTLEPGQSKGQSEFALHTTSTIGVHSEPLHALSTPPDEARASVLVSGDDDGVVAVWSLDSSGSPEIKHKLKPTGFPVTCIQALSSTWAVAGDVTGKLRLIHLEDGYVAADVGAHSRTLSALAVQDHSHVASVGEDGYVILTYHSESESESRYLHVWKLTERHDRLKISLAHSHRVGDDLLTGVAFAANSLITASYDLNHLKVWKALIVGACAAVVGIVSFLVMSIPTPRVSCDIACSCGHIQGKVLAASTLHCICYCDDCQDLASKLHDKFPNAPSHVNDNGGTHVILLFPSDVRITAGQDKLVQAKLKEHTTTRRVYASCCGTPVFNATTKNLPFLAVHLAAIPDKSVGTAQFHVWTKFARGAVPGGATTLPPTLNLKILFRLLLNRTKKLPHPVDVRQPAAVL